MASPRPLEKPSPFEAARRMSTLDAPSREPKDWSADMAAVALHRDRDCFLRIYDHFMPRVCQYSAVSTWLFRIARNLHIDRIRREPATHQGLGQEVEFDVELQPDPASAEDYAESVHLKRRIDALSSVQARLIRMSYFEAKTHQEIAGELSMPLGTVKSHLRRAFLRLQGEIGGQP